jgi:hypothetical protein
MLDLSIPSLCPTSLLASWQTPPLSQAALFFEQVSQGVTPNEGADKERSTEEEEEDKRSWLMQPTKPLVNPESLRKRLLLIYYLANNNGMFSPA